MARSLLDMAKSLDRRAAAFDAQGSEKAKRVAMAIVKYLAYNTPVDTSIALSNWITSVGRPADDPRAAFFYGMDGSTAAASAAATVRFAEEALKMKRPGEPIYIVNLMPYIQRLNDGWSQQSPGGFIEAAMLLGRKTA